jgi:hypothetical protein
LPIEPGWLDRLIWRLRGKPHRVGVYEALPRAEDDFEPYVVAMCDCGWLGDFHESSEPAFSDAYEHSSNVLPDVIRPIGRSG